MQHSTLRRAFIIMMMIAGFYLMMGACAGALESLSDEVLSETHAASGIRFQIQDLNMNHSAEAMGFVAHENLPSIWSSTEKGVWLPTPDDYRYGEVSLKQLLASDINVDGSVTFKTGPCAFGEQDYFARDTRKEESGSYVEKKQVYQHKAYTHALDARVPEVNARNRQGITLEMRGEGGGPFLSGPQVTGELHVAYAEEGNLESQAKDYHLGDLNITGLSLHDQRMILYPLSTIPMREGAEALYAEGDGLALEIGIRTSVDHLELKGPQPSTTPWLTLQGGHLAESFVDNWASFTYPDESVVRRDFLGSPIKKDPSEVYTDSTGHSDVYSTGYETARLFDSAVTDPWRTYDPSSPVSIKHMYEGRFMIGNLRHVDFIDYAAGNADIPVHRGGENGPWDGGQDDQLTTNDVVTQSGILGSRPTLYEDDQEGTVTGSPITERPMTLSFKTRTPEGGEPYSFLAMNMPLHGSIRIANVSGYSGKGIDYSDRGGCTMGPVIVDGLRVKHLYLEFPGRPDETYTLTTAYAVGTNGDVLPHDYAYKAGELPRPQPLPADGLQAEHNPMGRGAQWFLDRLGKGAPDGAANPSDPGWDQYRVYLGEGANKAGFWQLREPMPPQGYFP